MARLAAAALALLAILLAASAYADNAAAPAASESGKPASGQPKSYFTAPVVPLSPAAMEEVANGPSSEASDSDPDAGGVGSPGASYPAVTDNIDSLAPTGAPSASAASAAGINSFVAAVSVIAAAGYFAF